MYNMYVLCMSITLKNANFLYVACTGSTAHAHGNIILSRPVHEYWSVMDRSVLVRDRWIIDPRDKGLCRGNQVLSRVSTFLYYSA